MTKKRSIFPQVKTLIHSIAKLERVVSFAADEVRVVHEESLKVAAELEVLRSQNLRLHKRIRQLERKDGGSTEASVDSIDGSLNRRISTLERDVMKLEELVVEETRGRKADYRSLEEQIDKFEDCCENGVTATTKRSTTTARTGSSSGNVVFCAKGWNPQKPSPEEPLRLDQVSLQDEAGGDWFTPEDGTFEAPRSGYYLLTVYAETRTCGSLSLCAPTVIALARNEDANYKTFATGSASERRNDFEQISASLIEFADVGDRFQLRLAEAASFEGITKVEFCGYRLGG